MDTEGKVKIEQISTEKVIPYARNPRKIAGAVDGVAASIKEFGFLQLSSLLAICQRATAMRLAARPL